MDLFRQPMVDIIQRATELFTGIEGLPLELRIEACNEIKKALHAVSPFQAEPVDCVLWVKAGSLGANDYNPNTVAPPEMRLLEHSIRADGFTQPIVASQTADRFIVVDGFHRNKIGKNCRAVRDRIHGYLPITTINEDRTDLKDRIAATIRHNRARGVHGVIPLIDIVTSLVRQGWTDSEIAKELGMDADEVLRFKQNSGLPELFKDREYGRAWE